MFPVLFTIQGHPLTTWPVFTLAGVWAAWFVLRGPLQRARIPLAQIRAFFIACVPVWFLGAHLAQRLTVGGPSWGLVGDAEGGHVEASGLVLYGGVIAVLIFGGLFWKIAGWGRKLLLEELWDRGAIALAWALMFGRLGCTFYGCCYGTPSGRWPGYVLNRERWDWINRPFPAGLEGVSLHPATLYEALVLGAIIAVASRATRAGSNLRLPPGVLGWSSLLAYAFARFFLELIRSDSRGAAVLGLWPSQWISVGLGLFGVGILVRLTVAPKKPLLNY